MEGMVDEQMLTDAAWEPLIEEVRPRGKTPPKELRRRKKRSQQRGAR